MQVSRVALDLAKNVIQVHAVDRFGHKVMSKAVKRDKLLALLSSLAPCDIGMEACGSAHHWGRQLQAMGHRVTLLPPPYVKPFVVGQKNDANDAAAICTAMAQPYIPAVSVKTLDQQDVQSLHRMRDARVSMRTVYINQIRGLLAEYGLVVPQGRLQLRRAIPVLLEDTGNGLSAAFRQLLAETYEEIAALDARVDELTKRIEAHVRSDE